MSGLEDKCEDCGRQDSAGDHLFYCSACSCILCKECWPKQAAHRIKDVATERGGSSGRRARKQHEMTELGLADIILQILEPNDDEDYISKQIEENAETKWFAVDEENTGEIRLHDLGRFSNLSNGSERNPATQFPCLVSFVGETGSGKSTLINALVKLHGGLNEVAPVMGTGFTADRSTSGDVHLFSDPVTYNTSPRPIYYADCEGLSGSSHLIPMGSLALELRRKNLGSSQARVHSRARLIRYGKEKRADKKTRQWAAEQIFPRILFTFSDAVCLVTQNFRKMEEHLENLLKWGDRVLAKSLNQPMLPYAIIVVNALTPKGLNTKDWCNVETTTREQLHLYKDSVKPDLSGLRGTAIPALAQSWRKRGRQIDTIEDLIKCYYTNLVIICIPTPDSSHVRIKQQYQKLYETITLASEESRKARGEVGLLLSSQDLASYLDYAFTHFSTEAEAPFDFNKAAFLINPVAETFKDHIAKLIIYMMERTPVSGLGDGTKLFCEDVAPLLASSIFLDATRRRIAQRGEHSKIIEHYTPVFLDAQGSFYENHWPCEETDGKGNRCKNTASGHSKGHQRPDGKIFGDKGPFRCRFVHDGEIKKRMEQKFLLAIDTRLRGLVGELKRQKPLDGSLEEEQAAARIHLSRTLTGFRERFSDGNTRGVELPFVSNTTCFSCLAATPIHVLTCKHVICQNCLESYSEYDEKESCRVLRVCPLCCNTELPWKVPWKVPVKPEHAGLRILSLDGGGVRSIAQLVILDEVEKLIDIGMPIQDFFDLIIGTSGGGIVAFALGLARLPTSQCIEKFKLLARQAFTKRVSVGFAKWIGTLIEAKHNSVYKSKEMNAALKSVFGEEPLFGVPEKRPLKVAVTATRSCSGLQPVLLANYNRPEPETRFKTPYVFLRAESEETELRRWEAVRATTAAPVFFKPFVESHSNVSFSDGGIKYNNPVALADMERKIIWPEIADRDPDILLSLGTGLRTRNIDPNKLEHTPRPTNSGIGGYMRRMLKLGFDIIRDSLDCEKKWCEFLATLGDAEEDRTREMLYCRVNPVLTISGELPHIDQVPALDELEQKAREFAQNDIGLKKIAAKLVASLFYFRFEGKTDGNEMTGNILCRLPGGSPELRKLTAKLKQTERPFTISNNISYDGPLAERRDIDEAVSRIHAGEPFLLPVTFSLSAVEDAHIRIYLRFWGNTETRALISGFPRTLKRSRTKRFSTSTVRRASSVGPRRRRHTPSSSNTSLPTDLGEAGIRNPSEAIDIATDFASISLKNHSVAAK